MEETTKILGLQIDEFISMIETILIVFSITAIITIQFIKIRKYKGLFKKLSDTFGINNNKKIDNNELVEKIIQIRKQSELSKFKIPEKVKGFINSQLNDSKVYIHFTSDKLNAERILKEGFKYSESIYKTSQEVIDNSVDLTYKLQLYRPYGNFLIVICIPKTLFEFSKELIKSNQQFSVVDNVLSNSNPNDNLEFTLPSMFVSGFIDIERNIITKNEYYLKEFSIDNYKPKILDAFN